MTESEEQQLRELGNDLAKAAESPTEPRCVALAFATPVGSHLALTMQHWIDLEAIGSPLLRLELPEQLEELELTANVFHMSVAKLGVEAAILIARTIRRAVAEAFSLALPMRRAGGTGGASSAGEDGFGAWLPLFAFLIAECGLDPTAARALRVDQAFALLAACRRNQGWECAGTNYVQRDVVNATEGTQDE